MAAQTQTQTSQQTETVPPKNEDFITYTWVVIYGCLLWQMFYKCKEWRSVNIWYKQICWWEVWIFPRVKSTYTQRISNRYQSCLWKSFTLSTVIGAHDGALWFHIDGDRGASYWDHCRTYEDLLQLGVSLLDMNDVRIQQPSVVTSLTCSFRLSQISNKGKYTNKQLTCKFRSTISILSIHVWLQWWSTANPLYNTCWKFFPKNILSYKIDFYWYKFHSNMNSLHLHFTLQAIQIKTSWIWWKTNNDNVTEWKWSMSADSNKWVDKWLSIISLIHWFVLCRQCFGFEKFDCYRREKSSCWSARNSW